MKEAKAFGETVEVASCTGRIMSHSQAFKEMSLEDFKKSMKDVYSETVTEYTNDKSPMVINRNTKLWITLRILLILKLS